MTTHKRSYRTRIGRLIPTWTRCGLWISQKYTRAKWDGVLCLNCLKRKGKR